LLGYEKENYGRSFFSDFLLKKGGSPSPALAERKEELMTAFREAYRLTGISKLKSSIELMDILLESKRVGFIYSL